MEDQPGPPVVADVSEKEWAEGKRQGEARGDARTRTDAAAAAKSIILFSDGTGNSSGKLFKTNVWRMYEAVDLGPSPPEERDQIAWYDNGVGTAAFRPLRLLQGIFGWGLKRNVLGIYRYACRNYRPGEGQGPGDNPQGLGDWFYGFGFSRGAFTMRLVIDLIASQGIVGYAEEGELARKSKAAYRAWCRNGGGRGLRALPTRAWRLGRDALIGLWHRIAKTKPYDPADNYRPVIRFVGVWDTVAAYGGPIVEITRAIDLFLYPLTMASYRLHPQVQCARHALALDDERDSFHPLLWDEVNEARLVREGEVAADRLQQVWFTGMHADVGGGYPDESLSYVSLLWMLEEARKAGLRTLDDITERHVALANSFGPMHDSRAGLASYYRYQPRKIAAWLDPVDASTMGLRDPSIRDEAGRKRGLLCDVKVHESVIARIAEGTDHYATVAIPGRFTLVPPGEESEAQEQAVSGGSDEAPPRRPGLAHAVLAPEFRARLDEDRTKAQLGDALERAWDLVWIRRFVYFATVAATFVLLFLPYLADALPVDRDGKNVGTYSLLPGDDREWLGNLILLSTALLPDFLHSYIEKLARFPWLVLGLVILILGLNYFGRSLENALKGRARRAWRHALGLGDPEPTRSRLRAWRTSAAYQGGVKALKWYLLPTLFGLLMVALIAWAVLAVWTQIRLPAVEEGDAFCTSRSAPAARDLVRLDFATDRPCVATGMRVLAGEKYVVTFEVDKPWADGGYETDPRGAGAFGIGPAGPFGVPLRRVINADYLQPVAAVRVEADGERRVHMDALELEPVAGSTTHYWVELEIARDGELFLFANDAALPEPFRHDFFYRGSPGRNTGTACVTIERGMPGSAPAAEGACAPRGGNGVAATARPVAVARPGSKPTPPRR